jgi:hypothetical protein
MKTTFYVMWFYISNHTTKDEKPFARPVQAASIQEAIENGVFYRSPEFRKEAIYMVWSDTHPAPWVGTWAELQGHVDA